MLMVEEADAATTTQETGTDLLVAGEYEAALRFFADALSSSQDADSWNGWASAHAGLGYFAEAVEGFRRAHELDPVNHVIVANLFAVQQILAQHRQAAGTAATAEDLERLHSFALAQFRDGKVEGAIRGLRELTAAYETSRYWNDLGTLHVASANRAGAEVAYGRAIELDSNNQRALTNLILLLEGVGRPNDAVPWRAKVSAAEMVRARATAVRYQTAAAMQAGTVRELVKAISEMPPYPPNMPAHLRAALSVNRSDSSYFVECACELLANFADEIKVDVVKSMAPSDYRLYLVLAKFNLDRAAYDAAEPLIQKACDANPADLYADRLLDRCVQHRAGDENGTTEYLATHFCEAPWKHFEISGEGQVFFCCPAWMTVPAGKMGEGSADDIWNSPVAQELRASILDGSYRYCSRTHCPSISARTLPARELVQIDGVSVSKKYPVRAERRPAMVSLAYDKTCNLACPQCRIDFIVAKPHERSAMDTYVPDIMELAKTVELLYLNGAGEVFGSRHSRELLQRITREQFPDLKFYLISNANLFDRRAYDQFDLRGRIRRIDISIDAATAETYAYVRRGGNFARLLANLRFLDDLRLLEGEQFQVDLRYVVSGPNYREMPAFVKLARSIHANTVCFTRFRNWGTFTGAAFNAMNITDPAHPEHAQFLRVLQDPALEDPIVDLGSVAPFRVSSLPPA